MHFLGFIRQPVEAGVCTPRGRGEDAWPFSDPQLFFAPGDVSVWKGSLEPIARVLQVGLKGKMNHIDRYFMALKACSMDCRHPVNHWVGQQQAGPTSETRREAGSDASLIRRR